MTAFREYEEVAITAMVEVASGDHCAWEALDRDEYPKWDYFDVEVRKFLANGEIEIVAEFEDLKEDEANRIFDQLCDKHPDADHSVNY